jgi:hypothetical protein
MGVADSPLRDRVVFVEGAARSGTSWLTVLLATHPQIAGIGSESHLFDLGVGALFDNFERPEYYLRGYITRAELVDSARDLCDRVLLDMRARTKPEAPMVVEKTPLLGEATRPVALKLECFPDAYYLHVVRDERAVARSLLKAPFLDEDSEDECARLAREAVASVRQGVGGHPRYRELAYEELSSDPVTAMEGVFEWCGARVDDEVRERVARLSAERYAKQAQPEAERTRLGRLLGRGGRRDEPPTNASTALFHHLIVAAGEADPGRIAELTLPAFELELRANGEPVRCSGDEARALLSERVGPNFRRGTFVDVNWTVAPGESGSVGTLRGIDPHGQRTDLEVELVPRDGRAARLVVRRPSGA